MNAHPSSQPDALSATFAALADPTRRAILLKLAEGEMNVSALAEPFAMSLPAVTKHLNVLERAGLVIKGKDAQRRPCRINAEPLKQASDWMAQYRQFWEDSFDRLDAYLATLQAKQAETHTETQTQTPTQASTQTSTQGGASPTPSADKMPDAGTAPESQAKTSASTATTDKT